MIKLKSGSSFFNSVQITAYVRNCMLYVQKPLWLCNLIQNFHTLKSCSLSIPLKSIIKKTSGITAKKICQYKIEASFRV